MSSLPTSFAAPAAAQQWQDPQNTSYGNDVRLENSQDGLQTEFTIDSNRTAIGWGDLQQPADNTLTFTFTNPSDDSTVLNYIGALHPSNLNGRVECPGCTVAFANPYGVYVGGEAILDVGNLALIAGTIDQNEFLARGMIDTHLDGRISNDGSILADGNIVLMGREVINNGEIRSENGALLMLGGKNVSGLDLDAITNRIFDDNVDLIANLSAGVVENTGIIATPNAALVGSRVINRGQIEIADGTLLMLAADRVWLRRFDDPVSVSIPRPDAATAATSSSADYAIENDGRIDAGLGHVRLSAADPLGFGIRQGARGSIRAQKIELAGGESGRVTLSGSLDASDDSTGGQGGEIDVTGSILVLDDAIVDASGTKGGGTIQIGGEEQGQGELQRAAVVLVDAKSEIRADAIENGDGGRVIVFSEGLTSVDGSLSAKGGQDGGDGGFIETSGLARFAVSRTPDVSAANGQAGSWLIDPFDIFIRDQANISGCSGSTPLNCLNDAVDALLDPDFDPSLFDNFIRTRATSEVATEVLEKALAVGASVTLSTEAFGLVTDSTGGDITLEGMIAIPNTATLASTTATLTLLAAGNIRLDADILAGSVGQAPNLRLNVILRANDRGQDNLAAPYSASRIQGDVEMNANIDTGGGFLVAQGVAVHQAVGSRIRTFGGAVALSSGSLNAAGLPVSLIGGVGQPGITAGDIVVSNAYAPVAIQIEGEIDTSDVRDPGGNITMAANSVNVQFGTRSDVVTGQLIVANTATITSGGGNLTLTSGQATATNAVAFAGNVRIDGSLSSCRIGTCNEEDIGGDITIAAHHTGASSGAGQTVTFIEANATETPPRGEGGQISIRVDPTMGIRTGGGNLSVGGATTRSISIDGGLSTRRMSLDPTSLDDQGLVSIVALDPLAVSSENAPFGEGSISIGTQTAATIESAGIYVESRSVTTSDDSGTNPTALTVGGLSTAVLGNAKQGELRIIGNKNLDFGRDTTLSAESVILEAATRPLESTTVERIAADPALRFRGLNGPSDVGVAIQTTKLSIATGDGTTSTPSLFASPQDFIDDMGDTDPANDAPSDLAVTRRAFGRYDGLRLTALSGAGNRPDEISIAQDADFTISNAAMVGDGELNLGRAFDVGAIGANGMRISLESSDGVLTITDAIALNTMGVPVPGSDAGRSWVTLRGGLLLPTTPDPLPALPGDVRTANSVVFGDNVNPLATPFNVEGLVVSTPGDFTLDAQVASSIAATRELTFEAGRNTGAPNAAGRGTLTIGDPAAGLVLQAGERLSLLAGASGFGNLEFQATVTETISLRANDLMLRAGAGNMTLNTGTNRSTITGLTSSDLTIRDSAGAAFGAVATPMDRSFQYRQDAAIDTATDLPDLSQFGLDPLLGFRDGRDVVYSVRSDAGTIDISAAGAGDRFRDSALQLIGTAVGFDPALVVSAGFDFTGDSVEVGSTGNFVYSDTLATAFNRTALNSNDASSKLTLRAGVGGIGNLSFGANVPVAAARIDLIAGDGGGGGTGSNILLGSAQFDLSAANTDQATFVYQQDQEFFTVANLPTETNFGGAGGTPDILVIRSDSGRLALDNLDLTSLPVNAGGIVHRLVLEADTLSLTRSDGANLDLEGRDIAHDLQLRLRTNNLEWKAKTGTADENGGRVLAGTSTPTISGVDSDFDADVLLIEAFDLKSNDATSGNLSPLSADPLLVGRFDLAAGRGPTSIKIDQNGSLDAADLPDNGSISGRLTRTLDDDPDGNDVATNYIIVSRFGPVGLDPTKVNGSALTVVGDAGVSALSDVSAINFSPGVYNLAGLNATTGDSILIRENTDFIVTDLLSLAAANATSQPITPVDANNPLGRLEFEMGAGPSIDLSANRISLTAGPRLTLTNPDGIDANLDRDVIDNALLPKVVLDGINSVTRTGDLPGSSFQLGQNADLALDPILFGRFENVGPTPSNPMGLDWEKLDLISVQGRFRIAGFDVLAGVAKNLTLDTGIEGSIIADLENQAVLFDQYRGKVLFDSNDITFLTTDATTQLNLAAANLEMRATQTAADARISTADQNTRFRIRDDPDALERPIVRIRQVANFDATAALPLPAQYTLEVIAANTDGSTFTTGVQRVNLNTLDIELQTTSPTETLTLTDALRDRVFGSNLILKSAGDVEVGLTSAAAGFDLIDAAALQLSSLDIRTDVDAGLGVGANRDIFLSVLNFPASTQAGFDPTPFMIATTGDQRLDGNLKLRDSLTLRGRDITITGDIDLTSGADPLSGLLLQTGAKINFQQGIGTQVALGNLTVRFENGSSLVPNVEFGTRIDTDGDGIAETPVFSNQDVRVNGDIVFEADNATANSPGRRESSAPFATIGKALGDLTFLTSPNGNFVMGTGEKLAVGGTATISTGVGDVRLGDVAALDLVVTANNIALARRATDTYFDGVGETQHDSGPAILANTITFQNVGGGEVVPTLEGAGKDTIFGVPNPFDTTRFPTFLSQFALFELRPNRRPLMTADFQFVSLQPDLVGQVPTLRPTGSSRSDLSGAFGPDSIPLPRREMVVPAEVTNPARLRELGVDVRRASNRVQLARLHGAAIIDDTSPGSDIEFASVSETRLNARDVDSAIRLYEKLFGPDGDRADQVRETLQAALDRYLQETRVRRVIGFEFRRFVKNRPSSLIQAYNTLEALDTLFRYHRRLGLSPGEYRKIQLEWLRMIQPDGITLDELSETIHPSRYVRGSDILDIFGQ